MIGAALIVGACQLAAPARADDQPGLKQRATSGTVSAVSADQHTVRVKQFLFTKGFNLANDCAIAVGNKTTATVADLKPGMEIKLQYKNADGVLVASRIEQVKQTATGSVETLDAKGRKLTLDQGPLRKQMRIGEDCRFVMNDDKSASLNDLKVGQRVTIEYARNGEDLVALKIDRPSATFVGTLNAIDADADTVKAKHLLSNEKFSPADNCRIVINGKTSGKLSDLRLGEKVAIDYRDVNGIYVATRIAPAAASDKMAQSQDLTSAAR